MVEKNTITSSRSAYAWLKFLFTPEVYILFLNRKHKYIYRYVYKIFIIRKTVHGNNMFTTLFVKQLKESWFLNRTHL